MWIFPKKLLNYFNLTDRNDLITDKELNNVENIVYNQNEEELNSGLTEKQKETFEKFKDCTSELSCITEREAFSAGFILATRIMAEVMQGLEQVEDI